MIGVHSLIWIKREWLTQIRVIDNLGAPQRKRWSQWISHDGIEVSIGIKTL